MALTAPAPGRPVIRPPMEAVLPRFAYGLLLAELATLVFVEHHHGAQMQPSHALGMAIGWVGTASMILMHVYSIRRRVRALSRWGKLSRWLQLHIFLGLQGALLVTFHSLHLSTLSNLSGVTFGLTLIVVMSGIFGRYLFSMLPKGIAGERLGARQVEAELAELLPLVEPQGNEGTPQLRAALQELAAADDAEHGAVGVPHAGGRGPQGAACVASARRRHRRRAQVRARCGGARGARSHRGGGQTAGDAAAPPDHALVGGAHVPRLDHPAPAAHLPALRLGRAPRHRSLPVHGRVFVMTGNRLAAALFVPFLVVTCGLSSRAVAFDYHGLVALDGMVTVDPSAREVTNGELGMRARAALLNIGGRFDVRTDFWARLGAGSIGVGNPTVQELRELSLKARDLGGRVDLTIGRFHTPGGFWLIADGARLDLRYASWLTHSVYGGLRSFATDRRNADLTTENPVALPLAGTSLAVRHRVFDLSLTFTWARDAIDLQNRLDVTSGASPMAGGTLRRERHVEDEFFLDVQALIVPSESVVIAAGGSFGTRYDVRFEAQDAMTSQIRATLGTQTLGAVSAWLMAEWRPVKRLRLDYSGVFERIRLIQSQSMLFLTAQGTAAQLAPGDFLDNGVRAGLLLWKAMRADCNIGCAIAATRTSSTTWWPGFAATSSCSTGSASSPASAWT